MPASKISSTPTRKTSTGGPTAIRVTSMTRRYPAAGSSVRRSASDGLPEAPAAPCFAGQGISLSLIRIDGIRNFFENIAFGKSWYFPGINRTELLGGSVRSWRPNALATIIAPICTSRKTILRFFSFLIYRSIRQNSYLLRFLFCSRNRGGLNNRHTIPITRFNPESLCLTPDLPSPSRRFFLH